jgi:hypothetical protein
MSICADARTGGKERYGREKGVCDIEDVLFLELRLGTRLGSVALGSSHPESTSNLRYRPSTLELGAGKGPGINAEYVMLHM